MRVRVRARVIFGVLVRAKAVAGVAPGCDESAQQLQAHAQPLARQAAGQGHLQG